MINIFEYKEVKKELDPMIKGFYKDSSNYFKKESIDYEDFQQEVYLKLLQTEIKNTKNLRALIILASYCHMKDIWRKCIRRYNNFGSTLISADYDDVGEFQDGSNFYKEIESKDLLNTLTEKIFKKYDPMTADIIVSKLMYRLSRKNIQELIQLKYGKSFCLDHIGKIVQSKLPEIKKILKKLSDG